MKVLGLNLHRGASSAALLIDGKTLFTSREERFSRKLDDSSLPRRAALDCLHRAGLEVRDLDQVVCSGKPLREFERVLATRMSAFPFGARAFASSLSSWLGEKLWVRNLVSNELELPSPERVGFVSHLRCHASTAFFTSPYEESAVLVADEAREWETTLMARGVGRLIEPLATLRHPHSLVAAEAAFARAMGFEGESAVEQMRGSAHHGKASNLLLAYLPSQQSGSFSVDPELLSPEFRLCAKTGSAQERDDLAACAQHALETRFLELLQELHRRVPQKRLCFTGRLATNRSLVAAALERGPFDEVFVPSDPRDSGTALGAALHVAAPAEQLAPLRSPREGHARRRFTDVQIQSMVRELEEERILAWHRPHAAAPFPRRALALGSPTGPDAARRLRASVQRNDAGLPTRIVLPEERCEEYCALPSARGMSLLWRAQRDVQSTPRLRALAPSAISPDGRVWARVLPSAGPERDSDLLALLRALEERSLPPLLLETSLRLRGAPVAHRLCDAEEAVRRSQIHRLYVAEGTEPAPSCSAPSTPSPPVALAR